MQADRGDATLIISRTGAPGNETMVPSEMISIALLAMAGILSLGFFAVPLIWGANRNGGWTFLLLVGAFIFLLTANKFRPHPK